ncbi:mannose-6-phosphate isomerase, class I [Alkalicoccus luteus]|uniref:Mannose-6-phosphate isomerase n=1 Tax=Alkalicoccus luteus TaxID=1237094 RepID=A0A969TW92_9BACI|nr:mannose-6-phosphate isomerase, class I [Alkalicoccus luteus]NJP37089.1 mannose-6-phosphate isomerase, class I [Alkalicoccus luteus]
MTQLLKMKPVFKEKIWGGSALRDRFGYREAKNNTGECWGISGHANGATEVQGGPYDGMPLSTLWSEKPELFGQQNGDFPLLVKLLDAADDLSVQVHPNDDYAREKEGWAYGKTECWYIVHAAPGAELVLGHHAATREELQELAEAGEWNKLFRRVNVKAGDFVYVPSGTVHAIGGGITLLEVQQSSDITYRFYDYDRPGQDGELRELHLEDSIACSMVPHEDQTPPRTTEQTAGATIETLIEAPYFTVRRALVESETALAKKASYQLISVIDGEGYVLLNDEKMPVQKGDHFVVTAGEEQPVFAGTLELIAAEPGESA